MLRNAFQGLMLHARRAYVRPEPLHAAVQVKQTSAETSEVVVEGLGHRLECPEGIRLFWKLRQSSKHGEEL